MPRHLHDSMWVFLPAMASYPSSMVVLVVCSCLLAASATLPSQQLCLAMEENSAAKFCRVIKISNRVHKHSVSCCLLWTSHDNFSNNYHIGFSPSIRLILLPTILSTGSSLFVSHIKCYLFFHCGGCLPDLFCMRNHECAIF